MWFNALMNGSAPWYEPAWVDLAESRVESALAAVGRPRSGPIETVKSWGRSCLQKVPTEDGVVWIKHGYGLPPGEEVVLPEVAGRWGDRVPKVVASWPGSVAMGPLSGTELAETSPEAHWIAAAHALAELEAGEAAHMEEWIAHGVRDRRPQHWAEPLALLLASPVVRAVDAAILKSFEAFLPEFVARYVEGFSSAGTLVSQDSGCCNIHITDGKPLFFDWADVVIGHPVFSCDRLLDQTPKAFRDSVIGAFREPLGMTQGEFNAMRRSGVLHEILRYHDELEYVEPDDPFYGRLTRSVQSQIGVLVEYEASR